MSNEEKLIMQELRNLRIELGFSSDIVARVLGISGMTLRNYEWGYKLGALPSGFIKLYKDYLMTIKKDREAFAAMKRDSEQKLSKELGNIIESVIKSEFETESKSDLKSESESDSKSESLNLEDFTREDLITLRRMFDDMSTMLFSMQLIFGRALKRFGEIKESEVHND